MALRLSEAEIRERLTRLRNLEQLHSHDREQITQLKTENRQLKTDLHGAHATITGLQAQVEELARAVTKLSDSGKRYRFYLFGQGNKTTAKDKKKPRKHPKRSSSSYVRPKPAEPEITDHQVLQLTVCPLCSNAVSASVDQFKHYVEDIVFAPKTVTEYTIHRHWCRNCNKLVRPAVPDCLPGMRLGLNAVLFVLVEHYRSRKTDEQIADSLARGFDLEVSNGELSTIRHAAAKYFGGNYATILQAIRSARVIYADETGWHILGQKGQCWSVTAPEVPAVLYRLASSRAKDEIQAILGLEDGRQFQGVIVSDFYSAYDGLSEEQQKCWVHLLRDTHLLARGSLAGQDEQSQQERRTLHEQLTVIYRAIARFQQTEWTADAACSLEPHLNEQLQTLAVSDWHDSECKRIAKRIAKYRHELLTCIRIPNIRPENNTAERSVRPVVVQRKVTNGSRSQKGAATYSINKSVIETLRLEGGDFVAHLKATLWSAAWQQYFAMPSHRRKLSTSIG